jgi:acetyl-CoA acetyltransferase
VEALITGIGMTELTKEASSGPVALAAQAMNEALRDAGRTHEEIDGLLVHIGSPRGQDYDRFAESLGLSVAFASQTWSHGRFMSTVLTYAALAVTNGLANNVACIAAYRNSSFPRIGEPGNPFFHEVMREGGGPHGEQGGLGMLAPSGGAAMAWRRYASLYTADEKALEAVAISQRSCAVLNPRAALRTPLSTTDYGASPYVVEPLRRFDSSLPVDGAACVIVSRSPASEGSTPVRIAGFQGLKGGSERFIFGPTGLGLWNQSDSRPTIEEARRQSAFQMAGISPSDIDTFYTYDAFTPCVLFALEEFGFTGPGEASDYVIAEGLARNGRPWVNTNGGLLSEGHFNGWGHIHEMVLQVRGKAGARQIPGAQVAAWGALAGDALVVSTA